MATAPVTAWMSVEEYLNTSFRPDVDYVDGFIEERDLGEWDHSTLQTMLARVLGNHELDWDVYVRTELRIQVAPTRFRVPDVCVMDAKLDVEQVPRRPPLLCVEILSPEDRVPRMLERAKDYHRMGVQCVWVFHPKTRQIWVSTPVGAEEYAGGLLTVPGTQIVLDPDAAFRMMERRR